MQTEWSPGRNDEQVSGITSSAASAEPPVEDDLPAPLVDVDIDIDSEAESVAGSDVDTSAETDASSDDGMAGEEEVHRSAVDAVDELLDEVERAMARLDDGTYGRCETCGVPIDDVELAAGPLVRACRPCSTGAQVPSRTYSWSIS